MSLYRLLKKIERNQRRVYTQPPPNIVAPLKEYTIAAGVITLTGYDKIRHITVDTQSDDGTDDLDTINGGQAGDILICRAAHTDRTVVFKDGSGNMDLSGDFSLDSSRDTIMLIYTGSIWLQLSESDNNA